MAKEPSFKERDNLQRKRAEEFESQKGYKPLSASLLHNPTMEDKQVTWDGEPQVIEAGETKPFPNYVIKAFLRHTMGLKLASEMEKPEDEKKPEPKKEAAKKK